MKLNDISIWYLYRNLNKTFTWAIFHKIIKIHKIYKTLNVPEFSNFKSLLTRLFITLLKIIITINNLMIYRNLIIETSKH